MKVKRYNLTNPYDCGMEKHPTGEYVLFEDYKKMSDYADRRVEHKDMVCLPADLKNLRETNAHFAAENEALKNTLNRFREWANKQKKKAWDQWIKSPPNKDAPISQFLIARSETFRDVINKLNRL